MMDFTNMDLNAAHYSDASMFNALHTTARYPNEATVKKFVNQALVGMEQNELDLCVTLTDAESAQLTVLHPSFNMHLGHVLESLNKHKDRLNINHINHYQGVVITSHWLSSLLAIRLPNSKSDRWFWIDIIDLADLLGQDKHNKRVCLVM
jgi:hypothetical protein